MKAIQLLLPLYVPLCTAFGAVARPRVVSTCSANDRLNGLFMTPKDSSVSNSGTTSSSSSSSSTSNGPNTKTDRKDFIRKAIIATSFLTISPIANAFEGGVGGLGKTKPETNVVFSNPDNIEVASSISTPGDYNAELVAPDGTTPAFVSFYAPWPMLKSAGIESRDLAGSESAFLQVAPLKGGSVSNLSKSFFIDSIFGQTGKYGAYGTPYDIKIKKARDNDNGSIYVATFTTLTPSMRESDRKVLISTSSVGNGVFMLVTGTTVARFKSQEALLNKVAESFVCVEAPKSSFRR